MEQMEQMAPKYILTEVIEAKLRKIDEVAEDLIAFKQELVQQVKEMRGILQELSKCFTEVQLREYHLRQSMKKALNGE